MAVIYVFENPLDLTDVRQFEHVGPYIDFLLREFPQGFEGRNHQTFRNLKPWRVEDYDQAVVEDDHIVLAIDPAAPLAAFAATKIGGYIIAAIVSTVLAYAVNALFGPKGVKPKSPNYASKGANSPETVYSFSGASNTVRVGEIIPVGYGRNIMVPDIASAPYVYFQQNEQYLVQLLCLGQGNYTVHEVRIAGMLQSDLQSDVFDVFHYPYPVHQRRFGLIQEATQCFENVYTSPAVSDQELDASRISLTDGNTSGVYSGTLPTDTTTARYKVYINNGYIILSYDMNGDPIYGWRGVFTLMAEGGITGNLNQFATSYRISYVKIVCKELVEGEYVYNDIFAGEWFAVEHYYESEGPNGTTVSGYIFNDTPPDGWPFDQESVDCASSLYAEFSFENKSTSTPDEEALEPVYGVKIGPILAVPKGYTTSLLMYDIVFPSGGWWTSEQGTLWNMYVDFVFYAQEIDDNDDPIGDPQIKVWGRNIATNTPQRETVDHWVTQGRYVVTAQRRAPISDRANDQSSAIWTGLKAKLDPVATEYDTYGDVYLMMVRLKATNGIASSAHQQISVVATRTEGPEFYPREGDSYKIISSDGYLQNPIACFMDIYMNSDYGGQRPSTELDTVGLEVLRASWEGLVFSAVFDDETTVWDAMTLSLQLWHAGPTLIGSKIGVAWDKTVDGYDALFDEDSIVSLAVVYVFATDDDFDGVEGEYKNEEDGGAEYALHPADAVNPEQVKLWGCRSQSQAQAFVERYWRQFVKRRRLVTMDLESDAHTLQIGQVIGIKHPLLLGSEVIERCVISSIKVSDEFSTTIEGYVYEPSIY